MKNLISVNYKFLAMLFIFIAFQCHSQNPNTDCSVSLKNAGKEYDAGHFTECIGLLTTCVKNLQTQNAFQAYRLLALCYLSLNVDKKARESVVKMLQLKPDYKRFPYFDPKEFTLLLAEYEVWSKLEAGMKFGFNINSVRPINNYSITGSEATFRAKAGYQVGVVGEYFFTRKISVGAEILVEGLNYSRTADNVSGWNQEFNEKLRYLGIPLIAKYDLYNSKSIGIKVELGFETQFLNATNSNILLHNPLTLDNIQNSLDQKSQRHEVLFSIVPGIMISYKMGAGTLFGNIRYGMGLNNVVNPLKRYENINFSLGNQYIDSDIAFNTFYFSIGYQIPIPKMYAVKLRKG